MLALKNFIYEEDGLETIEIAIILAALIALAVVFKKQLIQLWNAVAKNLAADTNVSDYSMITEITIKQ